MSRTGPAGPQNRFGYDGIILMLLPLRCGSWGYVTRMEEKYNRCFNRFPQSMEFLDTFMKVNFATPPRKKQRSESNIKIMPPYLERFWGPRVLKPVFLCELI